MAAHGLAAQARSADNPPSAQVLEALDHADRLLAAVLRTDPHQPPAEPGSVPA